MTGAAQAERDPATLTGQAGRLRSQAARPIRATRPGWFAMVMATGIVSSLLRQAGPSVLSAALLLIALACFAVISMLSAFRIVMFPADLKDDLSRGSRAFTAFALVAACDVLGDRLAGAGYPAAAAALACLALAVWLGLACLLPVTLVVRSPGRPAVTDIDGSWYLCAVGTQSLAIAMAVLRQSGLLPGRLAVQAGLAAWLTGAALYLVVSVLVGVRLRAAGPGAGEAIAPYWVAMGGAAITAFAAAQLILAGAGPATIGTAPLTVLAIAFWLLATGLIPVLSVSTSRRRARTSAPLRYSAGLWMIVFPAGMYPMASMQLGTAARSPAIRHIGTVAAWPAFAAWALTFAAMTMSAAEPVVTRVRPTRSVRR